MITRREIAQRLDIPIEMVVRHGMSDGITAAELREIQENPPAWLVQSRANRTGKKAVWVDLTCEVCGFSEMARPKKWWPKFTYVGCDEHDASELPRPTAGAIRADYPGVGSRFIGYVDDVLD